MYGPSSDTSFIVCDIFTADLRSESVVSLIILALVTPFIYMKVIPLVVEYVSSRQDVIRLPGGINWVNCSLAVGVDWINSCDGKKLS